MNEKLILKYVELINRSSGYDRINNPYWQFILDECQPGLDKLLLTDDWVRNWSHPQPHTGQLIVLPYFGPIGRRWTTTEAAIPSVSIAPVSGCARIPIDSFLLDPIKTLYAWLEQLIQAIIRCEQECIQLLLEGCVQYTRQYTHYDTKPAGYFMLPHPSNLQPDPKRPLSIGHGYVHQGAYALDVVRDFKLMLDHQLLERNIFAFFGWIEYRVYSTQPHSVWKILSRCKNYVPAKNTNTQAHSSTEGNL